MKGFSVNTPTHFTDRPLQWVVVFENITSSLVASADDAVLCVSSILPFSAKWLCVCVQTFNSVTEKHIYIYIYMQIEFHMTVYEHCAYMYVHVQRYHDVLQTNAIILKYQICAMILYSCTVRTL